jgi:hypothetical protein
LFLLVFLFFYFVVLFLFYHWGRRGRGDGTVPNVPVYLNDK